MAQERAPITPPLTAEPETLPGISIEVPSPTKIAPPEQKEPLRVIAFDTQSTCAQLFSKGLSHHLRLGQITHPYVLAATLGPERIHKKIGNERTRELWDGRADRASPRVKRTTYEAATNDLLRNMDKLEKAVCRVIWYRRSTHANTWDLGEDSVCHRIPAIHHEPGNHGERSSKRRNNRVTDVKSNCDPRRALQTLHTHNIHPTPSDRDTRLAPTRQRRIRLLRRGR